MLRCQFINVTTTEVANIFGMRDHNQPEGDAEEKDELSEMTSHNSRHAPAHDSKPSN
jgi:hypothetical protein